MDGNKLKHNFIPKNNVSPRLTGVGDIRLTNLDVIDWCVFQTETIITPYMEQNMDFEVLNNIVKSELITKLVQTIFDDTNYVNIQRVLCPYSGNTKIISKIKIKRT